MGLRLAHFERSSQRTHRTDADGLAGLPAAQVFRQGSGRGVSAGGIFLQTFQTDRFQLPGHRAVQLAGRQRIDQQHLLERLQVRGPLVGRPTRQTFVENGPQGVNVGGGANLAAPSGGLFRSHVAGCAHDHLGDGLALLIEFLGQTEVCHPRRTILGEQHVGRLQVAVDDALLVGHVHGPGDLLDQVGRLPRRQQLDLQLARQAPAGAVLQAEVRQALILADLVDLDNVRVPQPGHGPGLGAEPGALGLVGVGPIADHLQGDDAVQLLVPGPVDDAHASPGQFDLDLVARQGRQGETGPLPVRAGQLLPTLRGGLGNSCNGIGFLGPEQRSGIYAPLVERLHGESSALGGPAIDFDRPTDPQPRRVVRAQRGPPAGVVGLAALGPPYTAPTVSQYKRAPSGMIAGHSLRQQKTPRRPWERPGVPLPRHGAPLILASARRSPCRRSAIAPAAADPAAANRPRSAP